MGEGPTAQMRQSQKNGKEEKVEDIRGNPPRKRKRYTSTVEKKYDYVLKKVKHTKIASTRKSENKNGKRIINFSAIRHYKNPRTGQNIVPLSTTNRIINKNFKIKKPNKQEKTMLIGDKVRVTVDSRGEHGTIQSFTKLQVKILLKDGRVVRRNKSNVLQTERHTYYPGDSEPEDSDCCADYEEVCSRQPFCSQVVNFFYREQREPRRQMRLQRDDIVLIDPDYSTPDQEQIAWVIRADGDLITVYKGGPTTQEYNKERLLTLRRSPILDTIVAEYKTEAKRNDIEVPERDVSPATSNKKRVHYSEPEEEPEEEPETELTHGETVTVIVDDEKVYGKISGFTKRQVKISLPDGRKVNRATNQVQISERKLIYPYQIEPESSIESSNGEVTKKFKYTHEFVDFIDYEQRHPREATRILRDDMVLIDNDYGIPPQEQIAWVLRSKGEFATVYSGGKKEKRYNKNRLLKLRRSKLLNGLKKLHKSEALRNDIETKLRNTGPRRSTKTQSLYITRENTIGCRDHPATSRSTIQPSPGMNRDSALGGEGSRE